VWNYDPQQLVAQFHKADVHHLEGMSEDDILQSRMALIREEYSELIDAMMDYYLNPSHEALAAVAKESADLHYVLYGTEDTLGIPSKAVFKQVHRSNMSKLINGVFKKRADGKILKGENYRAPNILAVIFGNDR
jgi:hypothetical protein